MVLKCSIYGCSNRKEHEKDLHFYRLPSIISHQGEETKKLTSNRRREWMAKISQDFTDVNLNNVRVCSEHFVSGKKADLYDRNNPDCIPSVRLGGKPSSPVLITSDSATPSLSRYERAKECTKRKLEMDIINTPKINHQPQELTYVVASSQTDIESRHIQGLLVEVDALRVENDILRASSLSQRFSVESFRDCDSKVNNFTGLSTFAIFDVLFGYLKPYIPSMASLDGFQVPMMTLTRLRLNLPVMFLAHEFGISQATVPRIFSSVIDIMFYRIKPFIHCPERETLEKSMPMQFRKHFGKKCMVIIDCFEVFIERPSSVEARAETWSSYKHHNTVKFLIGITPQGSISFQVRPPNTGKMPYITRYGRQVIPKVIESM